MYSKRRKPTTKRSWKSRKTQFSKSYRRYRKPSLRKRSNWVSGAQIANFNSIRSATEKKIVSSRHSKWQRTASNNFWYVESICPFALPEPFWHRAGGLRADTDINCEKLYIRGGTWRVTIKNIDNSSAIVDCWLAFMKDGAAFKSIGGEVNSPWHPYAAGKDFTDSQRLSKWHKNFILKRAGTNEDKTYDGAIKYFEFKIPAQAITVDKFIQEKPLWPVLYVQWRGMEEWHVKMEFEIDVIITFTEGESREMNKNEISSLQKKIVELAEKIGGGIGGAYQVQPMTPD